MAGLMILMTLLLTEIYAQSDFPIVILAQGPVMGKKVNSSVTTPFFSFSGIPYAKPPVGDLRFKDPLPPEPWNGTFEALQEGKMCKQFNKYKNTILGHEDCLVINVFTPQLPASGTLKPVMVFIHGGAFKTGSGTTKDLSPDYLVAAGVLFVSFNYRLDVFGFLSSEDRALPGNAGMKDQVQALRWIQQNIAAFGGSPEKVTLFGHSAGGASVHHLTLSPMTTGLFQRAIAQSGSAINPWTVAYKPRESAFILARNLGYTGNCSQQLADYLRTIDSDELIQKAQEAIPERDKYRLMRMVFVPAVEPRVDEGTSFLPDTPMNLLQQGLFQKVPFMTGITTHEGIVFLKASGLIDNLRSIEEINANLSKVLKPELRFCKESPCGDEMATRIKSFYFGDQAFTNSTIENFIQLTSDMFFNEGVEYTVKKMASQNSAAVYLYELTFDGDLAYFKHGSGTHRIQGVSHGDDLGYLFKTPLTVTEDSAEARVRSRMVTMWTNFAKTGNPTPDISEEIPAWLAYSNLCANYMDIGSELIMRKDIIKGRLDFWRSLYNSTLSS